MKEYFKSIRFRIWITFVAFTLGTMSLLFFSQIVLTPIFYSNFKTQEYMSAARTIKSWVMEEGWDPYNYGSINALKEAVDSMAEIHQFEIYISIPDTNGVIVATKSGGSAILPGMVKDSIKNALIEDNDGTIINKAENNGSEGIVLATYARKNDRIAAYIFIFGYTEPIGTTLSIVNALSFICSNVILIGACIVSIMISSHIANPLVKISRNANKLITGEFNMKVKRSEYDEIATLTENLNAASVEISKTETLRKDLMANVSHDLKTPLTMIKAYAEMIRDLSGNNPEKREKHLQVIIDETDRLTLLVNDILNLSKLESGVIEINKKVFNFSEDLREIINRFSLLDDAKDYQVTLEAEENIYINADQQKIEQVVYNLVNNAINYIGEDKRVYVRLFRKSPAAARFEVIDRGVGIPGEQIAYIWDRYYKIDRSENHKRAVKGTGLGLSIVKGILTGHGFGFGCDSVVGEGSTFWFEFAIAERDREKELLLP
ncbi:MAG: HAMP domain-containing histidine kinase [Firmicutes bacterium]|nr:HAMP domain-containing histidine kinase [[Eubacterium] siraeum]MCM1487525.1 HAMP domain-containing histidine kinase [Bacillota bacterium]